jgi:signal transduction histidine kinase
VKTREGQQYDELVHHIQDLEHQKLSAERELRSVQHLLDQQKKLSSRRLTQLKTIQTLNLGVFSGLREHEIYQLTCQSVVHQVGWDVAMVITMSGGRGNIVASYQATEKQLAHLKDYLHQNPVVMEAYTHHQALSTHGSEEKHNLVLRSLFQSDTVVMLPILFGEHCYGYLVACDTHTHLGEAVQHASSDDTDFLASMANLLAYAVQQSSSLLSLEEQNAKLRQLDELKDSFISITSHQLRTPLSIIKWILSILQTDRALTPHTEQLKLVGQAYETNERLIHVVNDLLNVSRIQEGKLPHNPQPADMSAFVTELIGNAERLFTAKGVRLERELPANLPALQLDPILFKEAVQNLLDNALDYNAQSDGWVKVVTGTRENEGEQTVFLTITNPGPGISDEEHHKIFEQFYRSQEAITMHPNGNGLGLYLAKAIVTQHQGTLTCESVPGETTTFTIEIPVNP